MGGHSGISGAVRRATLLTAALAAIGGSLAALPHPRDLAASVAAEPPVEEEMPVPEVTVTAVRPRLPARIRSSPVIASTHGQPADEGQPGVEDFLRQLFGARTAGVSSGSISVFGAGDTYSALRTQGVNHGLHASSATDSSRAAHSNGPDSRQAPPSMSERVGSLTTGASSAYGPHAVSGALDFILNSHFQGIRVASSYGFYTPERPHPARSIPPQQSAAKETFARRVSATTLQLLSLTPAQRPET